jgi:hypothetical protein
MSRINCRKCNLVNFGTDQNCRRCGIELSPQKSSGKTLPNFSGSLFPFLFKIFVLAIIGGICYLGYLTYLEETGKVVQQRIRIQEEKERIKNGYVDSIKKEVKKIATPTP